MRSLPHSFYPVLELRKQHRIVISVLHRVARAACAAVGRTGACASARASAAWSTLEFPWMKLTAAASALRRGLSYPFPVEVDELHRLALGEGGEVSLLCPTVPRATARS